MKRQLWLIEQESLPLHTFTDGLYNIGLKISVVKCLET